MAANVGFRLPRMSTADPLPPSTAAQLERPVSEWSNRSSVRDAATANDGNWPRPDSPSQSYSRSSRFSSSRTATLLRRQYNAVRIVRNFSPFRLVVSILGSIPYWLIPPLVLLVLLVAVLKNHLLASRQAQTLSAKEGKTMGAKVLSTIGTTGLEVTQGLGVGVTAGTMLA